jgi:hypothetical protein
MHGKNAIKQTIGPSAKECIIMYWQQNSHKINSILQRKIDVFVQDTSSF